MSADDVFYWANWVLVCALILGVVATYAIVASGNIRDEKLKEELKDKDEKIAITRERAAKAELQATEAKLELEKLKAPRVLSEEQIKHLSEELHRFGNIRFDIISSGGPEPANCANSIFRALLAADWKYEKNMTSFFGGGSGIETSVASNWPEPLKEAAFTLAKLLKKNGIEMHVNVTPADGPPNEAYEKLNIIVLGKPVSST